MGIEELGQKNRAIPGWIRFLVAAPLLGLASYWTFGYHGLYKWMAELQLSWFDAYQVIITGMLTYLICMIPIFPIFRILRTKYDRAPVNKPPSTLKLLEQYHPRSFKQVIVTGTVAVLAILVGAYMMISSLMYGDKVNIELGDLKDNSVSNKYVSFTVDVMHRRTYGMTESHGSTETSKVYVPVFQNDRERIFGDYYCIVEFYESAYDIIRLTDGSVELNGTLSQNSLPGLIRTQLEDKLAPNYWVLNYNHTPQSDSDFGWILIVIGSIFGGIFYFVRRRALKKVSAH